MAIYNPTSPPLFIHGSIDLFTVADVYPFSDEPSLQNTIALTYNLEISGIGAQQTYTSGVRAQNQRYTALDIKVGDYTTDKEGRGVYQIISIEEKTNSSIKCVVKDVDMLSYKVYGGDASPSQGAPIAFFELSDSGAALITGAEISNFFGTAISIDRIQGRSFLNTIDTQALPNLLNPGVQNILQVFHLVGIPGVPGRLLPESQTIPRCSGGRPDRSRTSEDNGCPPGYN